MADALSIEWAVAKWVPDLSRNEPVNIGVLLWLDGNVHTRFLGQSDETIDGRQLTGIGPIRPDIDLYRQWVRYWRRAGEKGRTLESLLRRRAGDTFYVEPAGARAPVGGESPRGVLDDLYRRLVEPPGKAPSEPTFRSQVDDLLGEADLLGNPSFRQSYKMALTNQSERTFPYAWVNGHCTVGYLLGAPTPAAIDLAIFRLAHTPHDVGKVVFLPTDSYDADGIEEIESRAGHVAALDAVTPRDVRDMFLADPRPRQLL